MFVWYLCVVCMYVVCVCEGMFVWCVCGVVCVHSFSESLPRPCPHTWVVRTKASWWVCLQGELTWDAGLPGQG